MKNPTEAALLEAFLRIARKKRQDRSEELLSEVDRLAELDGIELLRTEAMGFKLLDPEFKKFRRMATKLLKTVVEEDIDFIQIRSTPQRVGFSIYATFSKGPLKNTGRLVVVSDEELVAAWNDAGTEDHSPSGSLGRPATLVL